MSAIADIDVDATLARLAEQLADLAEQRPQPVMIGIHTGGVWLARHLHRSLGLNTPLGSLNISFYRDDFSRIGLHPRVRPSQLDTNIEDKTIILVDDVLHTGRTIRAAMNELFDYGRPAAIRLVALIDRGGRELPIAPDYVGMKLDLPPDKQVKLTGPEPLALIEQ